MAVNRESHLRSIIKGVTWRVIATSMTITIAYIITGEVGDAMKIGAFGFVAKIFVYYLHERAWQVMPRGSVRNWFKKSE